ncbi:MAG: chromatin modification- protein VID21 [Piccolia ochrophora]|nr:MAG: chromatin modification- protein VID21 [Piccolia ochrophora]
MTLSVLHEGVLRSKREELSRSVLSRKRKLRELYAVARSAEAAPNPLFVDNNDAAPPWDEKEARFLDANDILKGRYLNESTIPTRHLLHFALPEIPTPAETPLAATADSVANPQLDLIEGTPGRDVVGRRAREGDNVEESLGDLSTHSDTPKFDDVQLADNGLTTSVTLPRGDHTTSPERGKGLNAQHPLGSLPIVQDSSSQDAGNDQIQVAGLSLGESPRVKPSKVVPLSADDASALPSSVTASLKEPDVNGAGATVHLPPKEHQKRHLKDIDRAAKSPLIEDNDAAFLQAEIQRSSATSPGVNVSGSRLLGVNEAASSPSSTIGPYSANTPGVSPSSSDTSPDQEPSLEEAKLDAACRGSNVAANANKVLENPQSDFREDSLSPTTTESQLGSQGRYEAKGLRSFIGSSRDDAQDELRTGQEISTEHNSTASSISEQPTKISRETKKAQAKQDSDTDVSSQDAPQLPGDSRAGDSDPSVKLEPSAMEDQGPSESGVFSRTNEMGSTGNINKDQARNEIHKSKNPEDSPVSTGTPATQTGPPPPPNNATEQFPQLPSEPERSATSTSIPSPPERMTTRVSSGAIRHKSVSEILGEVPKPSTFTSPEKLSIEKPIKESSVPDSAGSVLSTVSPASPSQASPLRLRTTDLKDKERSKLSTVIFAKQQTPTPDAFGLVSQRPGVVAYEKAQDERDYLLPYFAAQAYQRQRSQPLKGLIGSAHKTITTADHYVEFHEQQHYRLLNRLLHLQNTNRWPMRQLERSVEVSRSTCHWDFLMDDMKWMSTDFREEKKWKTVVARNFAHWCAEWVHGDASHRTALQVRVQPKGIALDSQEHEVAQLSRSHGGQSDEQPNGERSPSLQQTPELISSAEDDPSSETMEDIDKMGLINLVAPATIFSLGTEDVALSVTKSPLIEGILRELPMYEGVDHTFSTRSLESPPDPDAWWKTLVAPVSKFASGKVVVKKEEPPWKRSRYDYEEENEDVSRGGRSAIPLAPENSKCALFQPENKHIRERIHAGHQFRPPSEFPMPSQSFYECRVPSQWTWTEDDELRGLVKEYSYNWSLISSLLSKPTLYTSGAQRRNPWECFERWISLEGLPADMQKTQYFRTYYARLDAAQRTVMAQPQPQQPTSSQSNNALTPVRRRTTQPMRVERKKNTKHLALIDAMRKLAKKRETTLQKQQHNAGLAAIRKANNEAAQPRPPVHTPQYFSRMKHEREIKLQERADVYRQQIMAQQRAAMQQRSAQQSGPHPMSNGVSQQGRPNPAAGSTASGTQVGSSFPNGHSQPPTSNQSRPNSALQNLPNGVQSSGNPLPTGLNSNAQALAKGIPQASMASTYRNGGGASIPTEMRVLMETTRIQQEQRRYQAQQAQQQPFPGQHQQTGTGGPSSSPNMANMNGLAAQAAMTGNHAMLAAIQAASNNSAMPSSSGNTQGNQAGQSGSPRMGQPQGPMGNQPQPLSSGVVPAINTISHQVKAQNPGASPEQIQRMTSEQLSQYQHRLSQAAMNAAAGAPSGQLGPGGVMNGAGSIPNPQLYAQILRAQQANQSRSGSVGPTTARPPSRGGTPQMQRSGSVQAGQGSNPSPRSPQAQMAGAK